MRSIKASDICLVRGGICAADSLSFEIKEKGIYGFLAKSEKELSLLADALAGICELDGGELLYSGESLYTDSKTNARIRRKISYAPSELYFDSDLTSFELIDLWGKVKKTDPDKRYRQIKEALELTGLSSKTEVLFEELTLSEKKRLTLACALVGNPDFIILCDPVRYLDSKQASEIKKLLLKLGGIKTVIILSTDPALIEAVCNTVAIIHEGRSLLWENTEDLLNLLKENRLGGLANALYALIEEDRDKQKED